MTPKKPTTQDHIQRINKVLNYIQAHLNNDLNLEELAGIACFSPFHFHRIFTAYLGETLYEYIKRIRLERATIKLCYSNKSVGDIGLKAGYDTPSAFSKAFKQQFGESPTSFRKRKSAVIIKQPNLIINPKEKEEFMQSEIVTRDDIQAIYVRQQGAYKESAEKAWQLLCSIAFPLNLVSEDAEFIGISYDDPSFTETSKLRYDACITIAENVSPNAEISVQTIAGGRYAKFSHTGPYTELEKLYNEIHRVWLPQNNHSLADRACFEKYLNSPDDVPPEQLITEIHLPIE